MYVNSFVGAVGKPIYNASKGAKAENMRKLATDTIMWCPPLELIVRGIEVDMVAEVGACATNAVVPIAWKRYGN
jgi:hypothetical protein